MNLGHTSKLEDIYNADKDNVGKNLIAIRTTLGYTQKKFGERIGVSERTLESYELGEVLIPLKRAIRICKEWNYSLEQIYISPNNPNGEIKDCPDKFTVDIRDYVTVEGEYIILTIPDHYWDYLKETKKIKDSDLTRIEKFRLVKKADGSYKAETHSVTHRFKLPIKDFRSFIFDIPYAPGSTE